MTKKAEFVWVPRHCVVPNSEKADISAKMDRTYEFTKSQH